MVDEKLGMEGEKSTSYTPFFLPDFLNILSSISRKIKTKTEMVIKRWSERNYLLISQTGEVGIKDGPAQIIYWAYIKFDMPLNSQKTIWAIGFA